MNKVKRIMNKSIFVSFFTFFLGLILFLKPGTTIKSIAIIIGIMLIIMGSGPIIDIIRSEEKKYLFLLLLQ